MKFFWTAFISIMMCVGLSACAPNATQESTSDTTLHTEDITTLKDESSESLTDTVTQETQSVADETEDQTAEKTNEDTTTEETTIEETTTVEEDTYPMETSHATLYQLAPENGSLMQSYVIKTQNGKLIVIDGGIDGYGLNNPPYMPAALRAISGVSAGEYFEVEAWFLSHAHKDHIYELSKMMAEYSADSNYKINNIYFDFPDFGTPQYPYQNGDMEISKIRENMNKYGEIIGANVKEGSTYYDDLNGAVINADSVSKGLSFEIDGVRIDVLQTWSPEEITGNVNDTSIVLRVWVGGQSILFLNDLGNNGGRRLLDTYGEELKSDIVQMAHHGQDGVNKDVYDAIDAKVHLWPTPIWVWKNENKTYQIDEVREWLYGENFLEADEYNIVACLYPKYPLKAATKVNLWKSVLDNMKIELPYLPAERSAVATE